MPFCPNCGYEYLPDIAACPDCGAKLVEYLSREEVDEKHTTWIKLPTLPGRLYAEMLKEIFDKEGIPSFIQGSPLRAYMPQGSAGDMVTLMVPAEYEEKCVEIQKEMFGNL